MTKTKKIVLAIVAVAIVALLAFAAVGGGHLATAPCVDCGGAGLVDDAACETCAGEGNVTASWWALVPPVIAIGLALITKEVYSSLFIGIVAGAILGSNFSFTGTMDLITGNALIDAVSGTAGIFIFLVVLGVVVALINKSGGSAAFGAWAEKNIKSRVGAMLATFVLGVLIFIDDYFNCLTVGSVMRPVTDSKKVSRAKLSYLIDATAAPICMIAPISSWAAAVASYAPEGEGLSLFIRAIPYNFYSLLTLVFIVAISLMKFDYGPMRIHEVNAKLKGDLYTAGEKAEVTDEGHNVKGKVIDLVLPILVLIVACVFALVYNGGILDGANFIDAFSNTDATVGLPWGSIIALVFAIAYFCIRKVVTFKEAMECIPKGFIAMVPAILILTFATALKNMTGVLGAKPFVNDVMSNVPDSLASFIPAIVFLVACFISFATGTSWGTFGILIPIVVTIFDAGDPLQIVAMSACLAGSVCGDHCSPISDTTIMSSAGGQCNHLNHVSTQLPYAISVAAISFVMYIVAGFIQSAAVVLPIGVVVTVAFLFVMKGIMAKKYGKDNI
ncbi:MAG: Na+/H+ antiporter NhaC family protein [Clostridia bacterium]|nr:Na+/H+ antiporter NhaC family protein [Clostridia bacterium]